MLTYSVPVDLTLRFFLNFARIGSMAMLIPLIGEQFIPARVRLVFAVFLSILLIPVLKSYTLPAVLTADRLFSFFLSEIIIGLILGIFVRILVVAADMASQFITQSLGLSLGDTLNPSLGQSTPVLGTFLSLLVLVIFFSFDGHYYVIQYIFESYKNLPLGGPIIIQDFSDFAVRVVSDSLVIALKIATPFIFFGIILNLGMGLISKLMPMVSITFLSVPISVLAGIVILFILLDPITKGFIDHLKGFLESMVLGSV